MISKENSKKQHKKTASIKSEKQDMELQELLI